MEEEDRRAIRRGLLSEMRKVRGAALQGRGVGGAGTTRRVGQVLDEGPFGHLGVLKAASDKWAQLDYQSLPPDLQNSVEDAAWELVTAGLLVPSFHQAGRVHFDAGPTARQSGGFYLTHRAMDHLNDEDVAPFDPFGITDAFRREFHDAEDLDVLCAYLSEAVRAYSLGLCLSCAVTVGCAYELALLQLGEAMVASPRWQTLRARLAWESEKVRKAEEAALNAVGQTDGLAKAGFLTDALRRVLLADDQLARDERIWVSSAFATAFHHVRERRNEAGHPTGRIPTRDDLLGPIVQFPSVYRHVRTLLQHYRSLMDCAEERG